MERQRGKRKKTEKRGRCDNLFRDNTQEDILTGDMLLCDSAIVFLDCYQLKKNYSVLSVHTWNFELECEALYCTYIVFFLSF